MTYCVGWKYKNSVYLLADTAVTHSNQPETRRSSFGQIHDKVRGECVEEALLKIVPIAPGVAVTFSGDVQLAGEIIEFLQNKLLFAETYENLFKFLDTELGPFPRNRPVQLLFAASTKNGDTDLLCWDSIRGLEQNNVDFYQIGSFSNSHHAGTTFSVKDKLPNAQISEDHFLPVLGAVIQSYGIYDNIINKNTGGVICGLRSHNGAIEWQEDTNYILYNPSLSEIEYISAFIRDNVLVVISFKDNGTRILSNSISTPVFRDWLKKWESHIHTRKTSDQYRYWTFISKPEKLITIIRRESFEREGTYFKIKYIGNGKFDLKLNPELDARLRQKIASPGDGDLKIFFD